MLEAYFHQHKFNLLFILYRYALEDTRPVAKMNALIICKKNKYFRIFYYNCETEFKLKDPENLYNLKFYFYFNSIYRDLVRDRLHICQAFTVIQKKRISILKFETNVLSISM